MKKIIVIGCPGSGKSCFSRALHDATGIPLYHLDMMFWNADKTTVEKSVFLERLLNVINTEEWIIDGNYSSTMEIRIAACDTVFFLDIPTNICLDGVRERRGKERTDMPWIETCEDSEFTEYIKGFGAHSKPKIIELLDKYREKSITVFKSREEADAYLKGFNL